jgi:hypothetical protein
LVTVLDSCQTVLTISIELTALHATQAITYQSVNAWHATPRAMGATVRAAQTARTAPGITSTTAIRKPAWLATPRATGAQVRAAQTARTARLVMPSI